MNIFELFGTIAIDNAKANKAISDTDNKASGLSNTMEAAFGKIGSLAKKVGTAVVAAFAVDKIKDFGKDCAETYASIAAEQASFEQIMGDYAYMAQEKMDKVASETGMVSSRLTPYMTSMTAKFKGLGYGVDEATNLAQEGLTIAADASAFWDKSLDESMSHLNSFINGSYEGGEAIGLFANDTQMAAYAVKKGIVSETKAWSALDEATKQATRLQYAKDMMAQSGATGQAAKESGEYANVLANLNEHMRQLKGVIGKPILEKLILPAMRTLNKIMPGLTEKTEAFMTGFSNGLDKVAGYFKDVFTENGLNLKALPQAFKKMGTDIVSYLKNLSVGNGEFFRNIGQNVGNLVVNLGKAILGALSKLVDDIPSILSTVANAISTAWQSVVWPLIQGYFKAIFGVDLPDWSQIATDISTGWNTVIWPAIQNFFKTVFGIELPSWTDLTQKISDGWNNVIWPAIHDFFKAIFELNLPYWSDLATKIANGWNDVIWPEIQNYFKATFGIDLPDWNDLALRAAQWWEDEALPAIQGFIKAPFGIELQDFGTVAANIKAWWDDVLKTVGDIFKSIFEVKLPSASEVADGITSWWNGVKSSIAGIFNINANVSHSFGGGSSTGTGGGRSIPGHANGLDFVPRDGYLARLHYGETVLNRANADAWRSGTMGSAEVGRLETAINALSGLMQQMVANTRGGQQIVLDSGVLVGQLAPRMDEQLGTISGRKGRRN
jgi:hypothetical protein